LIHRSFWLKRIERAWSDYLGAPLGGAGYVKNIEGLEMRVGGLESL
jgi:hypothetical protein